MKTFRKVMLIILAISSIALVYQMFTVENFSAENETIRSLLSIFYFSLITTVLLFLSAVVKKYLQNKI